MEAKHTPGPWRTLAIAKGRVIGDATAIGYEKIQVANHNATVSTVYRASDARLISAAPDLAAWAVDACSIIEQAIEYSEWNATNFGRGTTFRSGGYDADYVLEALRAALRKAGVLA